MMIENLELYDLDMHCAILRLPRVERRIGQLQLFDTRSEDQLRGRMQQTVELMIRQCFDTEASQIEKIEDQKPSPVWRVIITYCYQPRMASRVRILNPSG